jgi:hypothetical protein
VKTVYTVVGVLAAFVLGFILGNYAATHFGLSIGGYSGWRIIINR